MLLSQKPFESILKKVNFASLICVVFCNWKNSEFYTIAAEEGRKGWINVAIIWLLDFTLIVKQI